MIGSLRKNGWNLRAQILHAPEDVFLNTIAKPHAILSTITKDIAIRILRGSQILKLQQHAFIHQ